MTPRPAKVLVQCAVCAKEWAVKPSRAAQNNAITCSRECLATLRSRNIIRYRGSADTRTATCAECGEEFTRKPSQLAKYGASYCGRECHAKAKLGVPNLKLRTREKYSCETCGAEVWRTESTKEPHVYCSSTCWSRAPRSERVERIAKPCATCGEIMIMLPCDAKRFRFCSSRCAARTIQGAKRGLPGRAWPAEQKAVLSKTLREKYRTEWVDRVAAYSERMTGAGNPQWRGGRSLLPYSPGFTRGLKRRIAERDGNRCRLCDAPKGINTHAVHHIDGGKTNHAESNLILLCHKCHTSLHHGLISLDVQMSVI